MRIGERLSDLREQKKMSQGDVETRTGLLRCYISRVENGHTVPSVETSEKMARALEIPTYRLFTDDAQIKKPNIPRQEIPSPAVNTRLQRGFSPKDFGLGCTYGRSLIGWKERTYVNSRPFASEFPTVVESSY